jgi:hypothetical protein
MVAKFLHETSEAFVELIAKQHASQYKIRQRRFITAVRDPKKTVIEPCRFPVSWQNLLKVNTASFKNAVLRENMRSDPPTRPMSAEPARGQGEQEKGDNQTPPMVPPGPEFDSELPPIVNQPFYENQLGDPNLKDYILPENDLPANKQTRVQDWLGRQAQTERKIDASSSELVTPTSVSSIPLDTSDAEPDAKSSSPPPSSATASAGPNREDSVVDDPMESAVSKFSPSVKAFAKYKSWTEVDCICLQHVLCSDSSRKAKDLERLLRIGVDVAEFLVFAQFNSV